MASTRAASRRPPRARPSRPTTIRRRRARPRTAGPRSWLHSSPDRDPGGLRALIRTPSTRGGFLMPGVLEADERRSPPPRVVGLTIISLGSAVALLYYGQPI